MEQQYPQIKRISNPKLRKLVADFIGEYEYYANKNDAEDECLFASEQFVQKVLDEIGELPNMGVIAVGRTKQYRKYCYGDRGHYVVRIGQLRIDFTARQFHNNFSFPKIWLVSKREDNKVRWQNDHGKAKIFFA
jgi:hypothetical protein